MRVMDTLNQPHESGEPSQLNHECKEHWTRGSRMNHEVIRQRMEELLLQYTTDLAESDKRLNELKHQAWLIERRALETRFYAAMQHFESLLYDPPPEPRPAMPDPPAPPVPDLTPKVKRGRGRPFTGGRKPRDRRVNRDDDSW